MLFTSSHFKLYQSVFSNHLLAEDIDFLDSLTVSTFVYSPSFGKPCPTKTDEFSEKFQKAFAPPASSFLRKYIADLGTRWRLRTIYILNTKENLQYRIYCVQALAGLHQPLREEALRLSQCAQCSPSSGGSTVVQKKQQYVTNFTSLPFKTRWLLSQDNYYHSIRA